MNKISWKRQTTRVLRSVVIQHYLLRPSRFPAVSLPLLPASSHFPPRRHPFLSAGMRVSLTVRAAIHLCVWYFSSFKIFSLLFFFFFKWLISLLFYPCIYRLCTMWYHSCKITICWVARSCLQKNPRRLQQRWVCLSFSPFIELSISIVLKRSGIKVCSSVRVLRHVRACVHVCARAWWFFPICSKCQFRF